MTLTNALLVRWADGFVEVADAPSIATNGRHEGFLSAGNAPSIEEATRTGQGVLARFATDNEKVTAMFEAIDDTDRPYTGFGVGDTITVPDSTGAAATRRVAGITVTEDEDGVLLFVPELQS